MLPQRQHNTRDRLVRIFKLTPIHASMIIIFPEFAEFSEIYAPLWGKTPLFDSDVMLSLHFIYKQVL